VEKYCGVPVLGVIPRLDNENFPERHMGLTPFQEHPEVEKAIDAAAEVIKKHVDVEGLIETANRAEGLDEGQGTRFKEKEKLAHKVRIGIIKDSAFQFYYPENLIELKKHGAEIIEISALKEKHLPEIDALYIGGGFPETHAIALAENSEFRESVKNAAMNGLPIYAECGGLMYLGKGFLLDGRMYPMAGIFPLIFSLEKRPQAHGYSIIEVENENPFYSKGAVLKGHEFHYSRAINTEEAEELRYAVRMKRGQGIYNKKDGVCYKNVFATYTHLHAYGAEEWVEGMMRAAMEYKKQTIDNRP
jgi:cobyrinic acid a,c-diamide synthase